MEKTILLFMGLFCLSCAHTVDFRTNTFFNPIAGDHSWSGNFSAVANAETKVTLINDVTTNPPTRTTISINNDYDFTDLFLLSYIGIDANLTLIPQLNAFISNDLTGLRWQFLGNGANHLGWVAALQAGVGGKTQAHEQTDNNVVTKATSKVTTINQGISLGYQFSDIVLYLSYVKDEHKTSTTVSNSYGSFGPYADKGTHQITSLGMSSVGSGIQFGFEYSLLQINWNLSEEVMQHSTGLKLGYAW